MFRLLYISTARPGMDAATLEKILKASQISNHAKGLSGLLIHDGQRFLQYLEGDEAVIRDLYTKIKSDPRHFAVVTLRESHGEDRQFGEWDMAMMSGISGADFDHQVERVSKLVEGSDVLTAAEIKGFVNKLAA